MPPLVLHIGLHKTATTSLQRFFAERQKLLNERRVKYLPLAKMRQRFTKGLFRRDADAIADLKCMISNHPGKSILLSDENLIGHPGEVPSGRIYSDAEAVTRTIADAAGDVPIVVFLILRDPSEFLRSMYCEYLRHWPYQSFKQFTRTIDPFSFSFYQIFTWLQSMPENVKVQVIPYEVELGGGLRMIADAMLRAVFCGGAQDINLDELENMRSRASFTAEEVALFDHVAGLAGADVAQDLVRAVERRQTHFGSESFAPWTEVECVGFRQRYVRDLKALRGAIAARCGVT